MKNLRFIASACVLTLLSVAMVVAVGLLYNPILKATFQKNTSMTIKPTTDTVYDFTLTKLDGSPLDLADFKGKALLIVNTAAQCGLANQYKELEELYQKYKDKGLVVLGVSSNDFHQEIADHEERVCSIADRVVTTFPAADTVHVTDSTKDGYEAVPLYKWLNKHGAQKNSLFGSVKWNFHKFLIGKDGKFIDYFAATTKPTSKKVIKAIEKALAA